MTNLKPPAWFWIVAVIAVVWNVLGIGAYIADVTMSEEALMGLPEAERELRAATPGWVTGAFAIAVFAGLAAAIMLLLKRRLAVALFGLSLAAVLIQMGYTFIGTNAAAVLGVAGMVFPGIIIVLGALFLWFALASKRKGWLA